MKNPTAEDVLKKTFEHLDEIIEEGGQNKGAEDPQSTDRKNEEKHEEENTLEITENE